MWFGLIGRHGLVNGMVWGQGQRRQQVAGSTARRQGGQQKGSSCTTKPSPGSQVARSVLTGCCWAPHRRWSVSKGPGYHLSPRLQQGDRQAGRRRREVS